MATAKKAATKTAPKTEGTKYVWYGWASNGLDVDSGWHIGLYASLESVIKSSSFEEFFVDLNAETIYLLATTEDGKPPKFLRLAVKDSGYSYKEV